MVSGSTSKEGLRQRNVASSKKNGVTSTPHDVELDKLVKANAPTNNSDLQYKIALAIITILALVTRFWGISHPNEVVFDEVHFGKVCTHPLSLVKLVRRGVHLLTKAGLLAVCVLLS